MSENHMRTQVVVITFWLGSLKHTYPNKPQHKYHVDSTEYLRSVWSHRKIASTSVYLRISTYICNIESVPRPEIDKAIELKTHTLGMQPKSNGFSRLAVNRQAISWITRHTRDISRLTAMWQFAFRRGGGRSRSFILKPFRETNSGHYKRLRA
jgi:hypothetical protein